MGAFFTASSAEKGAAGTGAIGAGAGIIGAGVTGASATGGRMAMLLSALPTTSHGLLGSTLRDYNQIHFVQIIF